MKLNEFSDENLNEAPMGDLAKGTYWLGSKLSPVIGNRLGGQAQGRLETGKLANELHLEFYKLIGNTRQPVTKEVLFQYLKNKQVPAEAITNAEEIIANYEAGNDPDMLTKAGQMAKAGYNKAAPIAQQMAKQGYATAKQKAAAGWDAAKAGAGTLADKAKAGANSLATGASNFATRASQAAQNAKSAIANKFNNPAATDPERKEPPLNEADEIKELPSRIVDKVFAKVAADITAAASQTYYGSENPAYDYNPAGKGGRQGVTKPGEAPGSEQIPPPPKPAPEPAPSATTGAGAATGTPPNGPTAKAKAALASIQGMPEADQQYIMQSLYMQNAKESVEPTKPAIKESVKVNDKLGRVLWDKMQKGQ
jgi:hypothetical protein